MWSWRELYWMNLWGWWPYACKTEKWRGISNIGGKILFWGLLIMVLPETMSYYYIIAENFSMYDFVIGTVTQMMAFQYFTKMFIFIVKRDKIKYIVDTINEMDARAQLVLGPKDYEKISYPHNFLCRCGLIYLATFAIVGVQWLVTPFIYLAYGRTVFPMDSVYPWDQDTRHGWVMSYMVQLVHLSSVIYSMALVDLIAYIMLVQTNLLVDSLMMALRKANFEAEINGDENRPTLGFCVKFHQDLIHLFDDINYFLGLPILMQVTFATVVMCLGVFLFTSTGAQDLRAINMMQLAVCQVFEMFVFNWLCQRLEDQDEEIMRAAYSSNWYKGSVGDCRTLFIIVEMSKRKRTFGILVTSNFKTFISVLQSTFSYYNFLTAMSE